MKKKNVYLNYLQNLGYTLFDYTELTQNTMDASSIIVNNTSFFVFFTIILVFTIIIIIMMLNKQLDYIFGIYIILIFSTIIYISSIFYRNNTLYDIKSKLMITDNNILQNKINYENSIIELPNNIANIVESK